jgi:aspartate racemase
MGPAATVDWLGKLVRATPATRDQDHIPVLVYSAPHIPDRTEAILAGGFDPTPALVEGLRRLEAGGAQVVAIPCNTAHHWYDALQNAASIPILHIVDAVAETAAKRRVCGPVGVLATTATVRSGLYEIRLQSMGIECLYPSPEDQATIMRAIRVAKAGQPRKARAAIKAAAAALMDRGAQTVVLACTELPLALPDAENAPFIDAGASLARMCVRWWQAHLLTLPPRSDDGPDVDRGFPSLGGHPKLLQGGGAAQRDTTSLQPSHPAP